MGWGWFGWSDESGKKVDSSTLVLLHEVDAFDHMHLTAAYLSPCRVMAFYDSSIDYFVSSNILNAHDKKATQHKHSGVPAETQPRKMSLSYR